MKELLHNIDNKNKWLIAAMGALCFVLYVIFLYFRPQESWCDDAFWADWARQLAEHNRYYTTVWGFGHPSYCPLYVFLMALWYKVVGFSFFTAQFPNILLALIIYWVLMLILAGRKHITTWQGVVCLSALFWFSPSMCGICNCGRIEMLCLLLGILTSYFFVRSIETALLKDKIALFICSLLLFATGASRVPLGGFEVLESNGGTIYKFTIEYINYDKYHKNFIKAHTCFNRIDMPCYPNKNELEEALRFVSEEEMWGFGIE